MNLIRLTSAHILPTTSLSLALCNYCLSNLYLVGNWLH